MKGKIIKIGTINAKGQFEGWHFDCLGVCAGIEIDIKNGNHLYCGYTEDELRQIYITGLVPQSETPTEPPQ